MMANQRITDVWSYNLFDELIKLDYTLDCFKVVSIDAEFPGFFVNTPRYCSDVKRYVDLKVNVDAMNLIQLGLTLSDEQGNIGGVWQFNFSFCAERDNCSSDSIEFLTKSGIDFGRLKTHGIDGFLFSNSLACVLSKHRNLLWVTFHGLYDLAHVLKFLTNKPLPNSILNFARRVENVFCRIVDVKYMARFCEGLLEGELGLEKLAKIMKVDRVGGAHQAGSDSLLTSLVFAKIKDMCQAEESEYLGYLYGIHSKICASPQQFIPSVLSMSAENYQQESAATLDFGMFYGLPDVPYL